MFRIKSWLGNSRKPQAATTKPASASLQVEGLEDRRLMTATLSAPLLNTGLVGVAPVSASAASSTITVGEYNATAVTTPGGLGSHGDGDSVTVKGVTYSLFSQTVYRKDAGQAKPVALSTGMPVKTFNVDSTGTVYTLQTNGQLYKFAAGNPQKSVQLDTNVDSFGLDAREAAYTLSKSGNLWKFATATPGQYQKLDYGVKSFILDPRGAVYTLSTAGNVWKFATGSPGEQGQKLDYGVVSFALGGDGAVYTLSNAGNLWKFATATPGQYQKLDYGVKWFVVAGDGAVYTMSTAGNLWKFATATPGQYQKLNYVAAEDSVWFLGTSRINTAGDYAIYSINNGRLNQMPGGAVKLTIASGRVTAVSAGGVTTIQGYGHPGTADGTSYRTVPGTLFGTAGPSYQDVKQGHVGDCWLLSGLAEVAVRAPADIRNMFTYNGTTMENGSLVGLYTVRLYNSSGKAEYVVVDTELPAGGTQYDQPINDVLWVALAEKAYAVANGVGFVTSKNVGSYTYSALDHGWSGWAFQAITGNSGSSVTFKSGDLASAWQRGQMVVVSSKTSTKAINGVNIAANHAYAVVGYNATTKQVTLFNPWGVSGGYDSNKVFYGGTVTATEQQLAVSFDSESFGTGSAVAIALTESITPVFILTESPRREEPASPPAAASPANAVDVVFSTLDVRSYGNRRFSSAEDGLVTLFV